MLMNILFIKNLISSVEKYKILSKIGSGYGSDRLRDEITRQNSDSVNKGLTLLKADFRVKRKTKAGAQVDCARSKRNASTG